MSFLTVCRAVILALALGSASALAADSSSSASSSSRKSSSTSKSASSTAGNGSITFLTGSRTSSQVIVIASTYVSSTVIAGLPTVASNSSAANTGSVTYLTGTSSATATSTASAASSTQTCNGYAELCARKYSNVTMVGAHNSPFVRKGSVAANQALSVTAQLNDGVRFLQGQMHFATNDSTPRFCHTSCDLLDAGPIYTWLGDVTTWLAANPNEVVTILLGNGVLDNGTYLSGSVYAPAIASSGILTYVYEPESVPVSVDDWPTLAQMIASNRRVVMFLDYNANVTEVPWLLDEFTSVWETPYDPTNTSFPCTIDRPPTLATADAEDRMYIMNQNLNVEVRFLGANLTVPDVTALNTTNAAAGNASLGLSAANCLSQYSRAPNVLNVDYYNYGNYPGSVFEVAAKMNGVTYSGTCCSAVTSGAQGLTIGSWTLLVAVLVSLHALL